MHRSNGSSGCAARTVVPGTRSGTDTPVGKPAVGLHHRKPRRRERRTDCRVSSVDDERARCDHEQHGDHPCCREPRDHLAHATDDQRRRRCAARGGHSYQHSGPARHRAAARRRLPAPARVGDHAAIRRACGSRRYRWRRDRLAGRIPPTGVAPPRTARCVPSRSRTAPRRRAARWVAENAAAPARRGETTLAYSRPWERPTLAGRARMASTPFSSNKTATRSRLVPTPMRSLRGDRKGSTLEQGCPTPAPRRGSASNAVGVLPLASSRHAGPCRIARPLIEGLKTPTLAHDDRIWELVPSPRVRLEI
jgi:hypothetical protein